MALKFDGDEGKTLQEHDCAQLERMSLKEMLYHVLTGEGSPFRIAGAPRTA